jgi:hypothetical protein
MGEEGLRRLESWLESYLVEVRAVLERGGTAVEWGGIVRGGEELERRVEGAIVGIGTFLVEIAKWHSGEKWKRRAEDVRRSVEGKRRVGVVRRGDGGGLSETFDTSEG